MRYYKNAIANYVNFSGRATRMEYWMFVLINVVIAFVIGIMDGIIFKGEHQFLSTLYSIFIFLPSLAIGVRRLHDSGRSGFWYFVNLIPGIGQIIFVVLMCLPSKNSTY